MARVGYLASKNKKIVYISGLLDYSSLTQKKRDGDTSVQTLISSGLPIHIVEYPLFISAMQFLSQSHHLKLKEYYYKIGHHQPQIYVAPDKIAESVIEEIRNRISGMENWWGGEHTITEYTSRMILFYQLKISDRTNLVHDTNRSNVNLCREFILSKVENEKLITQVEQLSKMYRNYRDKAIDIKHELNEIRSIIELGHNIKGQCKSCPRLFRVF